MVANCTFLRSCPRPGAPGPRWRAAPPERDERTSQNTKPAHPVCHVASARRTRKTRLAIRRSARWRVVCEFGPALGLQPASCRLTGHQPNEPNQVEGPVWFLLSWVGQAHQLWRGGVPCPTTATSGPGTGGGEEEGGGLSVERGRGGRTRGGGSGEMAHMLKWIDHPLKRCLARSVLHPILHRTLRDGDGCGPATMRRRVHRPCVSRPRLLPVK